MGNLKQRLIKAGTEYNYAEGVKVKATLAISANEIVVADGYSGPFITVTKARADPLTSCSGRLMIAKHDIPAGGYGVALPWKLVTGINTATGTKGNPVYLSATTAGGFTFTAPTGGATEVVIIGSILEVSATTGGILFSTDMGKL
jgi:hypothetical protein